MPLGMQTPTNLVLNACHKKCTIELVCINYLGYFKVFYNIDFYINPRPLLPAGNDIYLFTT